MDLMVIGLGSGIVIFTVLAMILLCFLCYRQKNRDLTNAEIPVSRTAYADPTDAITVKRSSTYSTPYDQWKSQNGVMFVRNISQKKNPGYYNVDVQDGLCERVKPPKKSKGSHREYLNVELKDSKKSNKNAQKEFWDAHVQNNSTAPEKSQSAPETQRNDEVPVRIESKRNDLPTPYSCIELQ
ncbi:uncharacterized protein LOC125648178 [Ostrea edulis]|uniref:uncharacterized protein LOC125648178 n=1 Tax=Ostrea edulis TaxID=37623 RepID=UPI0020947DE1|nr:uncharacterized protein LOC125648178 [Ostrea edulis]XP_055996593.1 uncharacterized protein LOC125648178 [Ostrea edulis]